MALEFRIEPTKNALIAVAGRRSRRPRVFGAKPVCPFDSGNEAMTPPTRFALPNERNWRVRCFENAFPFLQPAGKFVSRNFGKTGWASPAFGHHEVIVESRRHGELFQDFSAGQLDLVLRAYLDREKELYGKPGIKYVFLFKNHGRGGGASIDHEHSQIIGLPFVPPLIAAEEKAGSSECLHCTLLKKERKNIVFENEFFAAIRPSFARFPFEFWVLSKKHVRTMTEFGSAQAAALMHALAESARAANRVCPGYNFLFHQAPVGGSRLHFHVEVIPRTNCWAGAELGAGIIVNSREASQAVKLLKN